MIHSVYRIAFRLLAGPGPCPRPIDGPSSTTIVYKYQRPGSSCAHKNSHRKHFLIVYYSKIFNFRDIRDDTNAQVHL